MKKTLSLFFLCAAFLLLFPTSVHADIGPKPSVTITFTSLENETYYATLLSETDSTGPWSKSYNDDDWYDNETVWQKMNDYEDTDGFYFLGCFADCSETHQFRWNYYPPDNFKILLYFPEKDLFLVTEDVYEHYAFDSYYTVDAGDALAASSMISEENIIADTETAKEVSARSEAELNAMFEAERSYDYTWEVISLLCRIILTILLELGIALIFGYRGKKSLLFICITNVITQTILNVCLNIINYHNGQYAFIFYYVWLEILVFAIEAFIYSKRMEQKSSTAGKKLHPCLYALTANIFSFVAGIFIAQIVPGIF